MLKFKFFWLGC